MNETKTENMTESVQKKPLRLWPGVILVILQWLLRFVIPYFIPDALAIGIFGGLILGLLIVIWWAFFSRATIIDRVSAIILMIIALMATSQIIDKSIKTGMMGMMFALFSIPVLSLAFVAWAVACRKLSNKFRRLTMVATIIFASGFWALLRTNGMNGEAQHDYEWRWAKTSEERLLDKTDDKLIPIILDSALMAEEPQWPGFRGLKRDGIVHGAKIETNWKKNPPVEMWRRPIGPACSSFAVHGILLYTQEQRGEFETVSCYNLNSGQPIWRHGDSTRFWDSHAGAGPRSTPTLSNDRVYTLGATGILNALNAYNGKVIWTRNAAAETKVKIPGWAYTSSPLVIDSVVIVAIAGQLLAYDINTGKQCWTETDGGESYSSPHLMTLNGVNQILFTNKSGLASYKPSDGKLLWKIKWNGIPILQPAQINESDLLVGQVSESGGTGMVRVEIKNGIGGWTTAELWKSNRFRPYFNDFVIHKGHVYGFEGPALACMEIEKGNRKWKGGRYGGQLILLADQDLLLVLSEEGDLDLVSATPDQFKEIAQFHALKGKTWNHPVLAGNVLVVRNTDEMAAFRLAQAD
jgi:outer membrane protein assembly factor BamB